jgi:S1-C subfamily serine protease
MNDDTNQPGSFDPSQPVRIPPYNDEQAQTQPDRPAYETAPAAHPAAPFAASAGDTAPTPPTPPTPPAEPMAPTPVAQATAPAPPSPARSGSRHSTGAVIAAGLVGGLIGALIVAATAGALYLSFFGAARATTTTGKTITGNPITIAAKSLVEPAVAVARKVLPSVVNVTIYQSNGFSGTSQAVGNGSGVVYKAGGYIVTNNHVVANADRITVKVGMEELPAKVIGTDPKTDLAVIKVEKDLPLITVGDSSQLEVGQTVIAVGSPFGLDKTVTSGIVSALGRSEIGDSSAANAPVAAYTNLIQTDAAINPGNSGGALVDTEGKLVGINTMIATGGQSAQNAGVGFAIPSATVVSVADQIISTGKVSHPFLGVSSTTLTPDLAATLGKGAPANGAVAVSVIAGSPAAKAGIQANDVVVKIGDTAVTSADGLVLAIRSQKVGASVPIQVWRNGKTITVDTVIGTDLANTTQ